MTPEVIYQFILSYMPVITAVGGIIAACCKIIKNIKSVKDSTTQEYLTLKEAYEAQCKENKEMRQYLKKVLEKIDRIDRGDDTQL